MKKRIALIIGLLCISMTVVADAAEQPHIGLNDVIATVEKAFKISGNDQATIIDFTADFFQRTLLKKDGREMRADGVAYVRLPTGRSPLMYRFQYYRPYQQEIVSDGNSLWIYHPENREVILTDVSAVYNRPGFNSDRDRAANFLQGLGRISKDFQINFAGGMYDSASNYVLELHPRRSMHNTKRILLVVSRNSVLFHINGSNPPSPSASATVPKGRTLPAPPRSPFATPAPFAGMPGFGVSSDPFPILSSTVEDQDENSTTMEFANIKTNTRLLESDFSFLIPPNVQVLKPTVRNQPR